MESTENDAPFPILIKLILNIIVFFALFLFVKFVVFNHIKILSPCVREGYLLFALSVFLFLLINILVKFWPSISREAENGEVIVIDDLTLRIDGVIKLLKNIQLQEITQCNILKILQRPVGKFSLGLWIVLIVFVITLVFTFIPLPFTRISEDPPIFRGFDISIKGSPLEFNSEYPIEVLRKQKVHIKANVESNSELKCAWISAGGSKPTLGSDCSADYEGPLDKNIDVLTLEIETVCGGHHLVEPLFIKISNPNPE